MKKRFILTLLPALLLLAACSSSSYITRANDVPAWRQTQHELQQIKHWDIRGKISIRNGNEFYTADLYWKQQDNDLTLRLIAPFAQAATQFTGNDDAGYQVLTEQGEVIDVSSPEAVTAHAFGVDLPFTELKYWVRGLPENGKPVWKVRFNDDNHLSYFHQSGWEVKILNYRQVAGRMLPAKLFLSLLTEDLADNKVEVRLILQNWIL